MKATEVFQKVYVNCDKCGGSGRVARGEGVPNHCFCCDGSGKIQQFMSLAKISDMMTRHTCERRVTLMGKEFFPEEEENVDREQAGNP